MKESIFKKQRFITQHISILFIKPYPHFMCADDFIYNFCNCWNALKAQGSARCCFFRRTNIQTSESSEWWFGLDLLRNILGSYGRNTKKLSAYLEQRVSWNKKDLYTLIASNQNFQIVNSTFFFSANIFLQKVLESQVLFWWQAVYKVHTHK